MILNAEETVNLGLADEIFSISVESQIIKGVIICEYMKKHHELNMDFFSHEIQIQVLDKKE